MECSLPRWFGGDGGGGREREREGGSGVCLCVSFWQSFHPWGPFEMEIYTPEESRVARTRWGALALCRQAIGGWMSLKRNEEEEEEEEEITRPTRWTRRRRKKEKKRSRNLVIFFFFFSFFFPLRNSDFSDWSAPWAQQHAGLVASRMIVVYRAMGEDHQYSSHTQINKRKEKRERRRRRKKKAQTDSSSS